MTTASSLGGFAGHLLQRFRVGRVVLPLLLAFACSSTIYVELHGAAPAKSAVVGAVTFLLLFVQLRLIDDLDDLDRDHAAQDREALGRRLRLTLPCVLALLFALNAGRGAALAAVAVGSALSYLGPFVVKRALPPRPVFLGLAFLVFEGAPASFFAYVYVYWLESAPSSTARLGASVTVVFWLAYEFWKFSRKAHLVAFQPYFLGARGLRKALTALLACAAAANLALARGAGFGRGATLYLVALPLALTVWLRWSLPRLTPTATASSPPLWSGMAYMVLLEAGIAVELLRSARPA